MPLAPAVRIALGILFALNGVASARAEKLVTVRSVVDRTYATRRAAQNPPPIETYVFAQGRYLNAIPMDRYLERMDFRTIATTIAGDLKPRGYEPAKDYSQADLVLVVHWGVTMGNENAAGMLLHDYDVLQTAVNEAAAAMAVVNDPGPDGIGALDALIEAQLAVRRESSTTMMAHSRNEVQQTSNATLLGLQSAMADEESAPFGSEFGTTLRLMANEERYFIIVIAYDAAAMRAGRKKQLWTTRASIRAAGVNFAIALDRMSGTAGAFHGLPQNGLAMETSQDRLNKKVKEGNVSIGEIKVLGETSAPTPRPAKK